ncbi:MAG: class B sortase [Caldicoprobacterales bacterium]|jgi:sortase B
MTWRRVLIVILIGVFLYSSYELITYYYDAYKNKTTYDDIRKQYEEQLKLEEEQTAPPDANHLPDKDTDSVPDEPAIMDRYLPLLEINKDIVGWISVPDTVIDYPVVQAEDNNYYLRRDIYGERARAGTIFMDYRCKADCSGKHTILYGHHMRNGTMFKDLMKYKNKEFFQNNTLIRFDTLYDEITWEVFSVYITSASFNYIQTSFASDEEYIAFLNTIKEKSMFESSVELSEDDQILTLSTCTYEYDNARFVVHARRVRK